ncbi:hypothetical protein KI688_001382 [Linnemannia hyalina]|uniref:BZIP domain-containing protein n=2 Tax=Mortierellaceae TaxID=4854 RepID=A0A9P6K4U9_9FUNG|nr:hypothetical protein EC957_010340 [Mortierella hygrophila]KAG9066163.1 hypothetical protein KI688_001382 [Linnemannia hyalina]
MTTNNTFTAFNAGTAERLMMSADSLDFALQGNNKKATTARQELIDYSSLDSIFSTSNDLSASLFDDWLANDLQQVGYLGNEDPALSSDSDSNNSPLLSSNESDSPVVGFDSIASDADFIQSSGLDASMALFPEVQSAPTAAASLSSLFGLTAAVPAAPATVMMPLTPEAVQQAAAALNIPWSKSLETAVLAQSLLASIPMALQLPAAAAAIKPSAAPLSPAPQSPPVLLPKQTERAISPAAPLSPAPIAEQRAAPALAPATPRPSLSILSSTQTPVPGKSVTSTTYKSAYRSASLTRSSLKRERESSEPPSVLDGRDVSEMDETALKRAKNTDAARRSRHKKLVKMEGLEQRVAELEVENSMFETKLNEVELERSLLADKDQMQQARIQELERMLATVREKMY